MKNVSNNSNDPLNFIDLFSGAGGFSCGLEQAGLRCLLGLDANKYAMETFKKNHPNAEIFASPIEELTEKTLKKLTQNKKIHVIVGGPPCQGFSTVGRGDPSDQRNTLFQEFVRIVKFTLPDFLIIENVTGLLAKKNEKTLNAIFHSFEKLGYKLEARVVSANEYGVAEKRRRTIIIGALHHSKEFSIIFPNTVNIKEFKTVGDVLSNLKCPNGNIFNHDTDQAKIKNKIDEKRLSFIPEGKGIRYQKDEKLYLPKRYHLGVDWENLREKRFRQTKYQRLHRKLPSPTIMTDKHCYFHPTENRYLTPREAAAIQSFPNDFQFCGPITEQWRQIGNAVPPKLGFLFGQCLKEMALIRDKFSHDSKKNSKLHEKNKRKTFSKSTFQSLRKNAFHYKVKMEETESY